EEDEEERRLRAREAAPQPVREARLLAALLEIRPRLERENDAREGAVELVERDDARPLRRIAQEDLAAAPESPEAEEVVEVPEEDERELLRVELLELLLEALRDEAVLPCGLEDVARLGAVARNPALDAQLLERDDLAVVLEDDRERRRATLDGLHLEHRRALRAPDGRNGLR